ncbi:MAG: hypothetical protein PHX61_08115 [Alphaproteobacteria bacterium]|nr:hypothetical protein [Alphaproteobacteria bacterium]
MNEQVMKLLNAIGGIAESLGVLRDNLMKNGFTRPEAIQLCNTYLTAALMAPHPSTDNENY